jgi:hypothetical protein
MARVAFLVMLGAAQGALAAVRSADAPVGYKVADAAVTLLSEGSYGSKLYSLDEESIGTGTSFVLDSRGGSRFEAGYDIGLLIGDKMLGSLNALLDWMTQGHGGLKFVVEELLVWQWQIALATQTPEEYLEEMRGIADGAVAQGNEAVGKSRFSVGDIAAMAAVLANLPGDADDVVYVLLNEVTAAKRRELEAAVEGSKLEEALGRVRWLNPACSNFGAFGNRTAKGELYSGRNL